MHSPAGEGVEIAGQDSHQGFALAGFHLGNAALVEHNAADELHRVGAHTQHPVRRLPDGGKGLGQQLVQGGTVVQPVFEFLGLGLQGLLGQGLILLLQAEDGIHRGLNFLDFPLGAGTEYFRNQTHFGLL